MEKEIINFMDFIADDKEDYNKLNKEMNDFFTNENSKQEDKVDINDKLLISSSQKIDDKDFFEIKNEKQEDSINNQENEISSVKKPIEMKENNNYKIYKDKSEIFSCEITLEGANYKETQVRLILESNDWNIMFTGEIDENGKCIIPIKKMNILDEGVIGKIKLEVIAEDSVFIPWEDDFEVKLSKKVIVKIHENQSNVKNNNIKSDISVKIKK